MVAYASRVYLYRLEAYATFKSRRHQRSGGMILKISLGTIKKL